MPLCYRIQAIHVDHEAVAGHPATRVTLRKCAWAGCDRAGESRKNRRTPQKWCSMHRSRRRRGLPMDAPPGLPKARCKPWPGRFWEKVDRRGDGECWRWLASLNDGGYGQISINGRPHRAHRVAYELVRGPIPDGLVIDHECRNRWCVNPWHLEPVTNEVNIDRGLFHKSPRALKVKCPSGHEYSDENTRIDRRGHRRCQTCERRQSLDGYYRRKARKAKSS